ncbi:class I SAM-dependent methyltransferase [Streptomyces rhizosphaericus]
MLRALRLRPDDLLVDLGCGRGGPGLWLARATSARLVGVDHSQQAIEIATVRATSFVPNGMARFQIGTFEDTGLPDSCANGVVSMDALPWASDRDAALRELRRILRPRARAVFTGSDRLPGHPTFASETPTWRDRILDAGLEIELDLERTEAGPQWQRLYEAWQEHEAEMRADIGDIQTENMLEEARTVGPLLPYMRLGLFVVRAPYLSQTRSSCKD